MCTSLFKRKNGAGLFISIVVHICFDPAVQDDNKWTDFPWSSTIRINFQISLPYKFCHSTCLVIDWWFILVVVQTPSEKIVRNRKGFLLKRPRFQPKKLGNFHISQKKLGDFEGCFWSLEELRTPIPLTMKDLIVGQKPTRNWKLFGLIYDIFSVDYFWWSLDMISEIDVVERTWRTYSH